MKINIRDVLSCPVCKSKRFNFNASQPIEFECGSYIYEDRKGYHLNKSKYCDFIP